MLCTRVVTEQPTNINNLNYIIMNECKNLSDLQGALECVYKYNFQ
jgi:hypothetical protein